MPLNPPRILLSYFYFKNIDIAAFLQSLSPHRLDVIADSGAFSAYTQNQVIDVAQYADWLHRWKPLFTTYSNLDVKGNWRNGLRNQSYLESRGLSPFPVFHAAHDESWDLLRDFVSAYDYIGLGGMAGSMNRGSSLIRWAAKCFEVAGGKSVFHGFGMTTAEMLIGLPWHSVDSSSWTSGVRYGTVRLFDKSSVKMRGYNVRKDRLKMGKAIAPLGIDMNQVTGKGSDIMMLAAQGLSMCQAESFVREKKGTCKRPSNGEPGIKIYLSTSSTTFTNFFRGVSNAKIAIDWGMK